MYLIDQDVSTLVVSGFFVMLSMAIQASEPFLDLSLSTEDSQSQGGSGMQAVKWGCTGTNQGLVPDFLYRQLL